MLLLRYLLLGVSFALFGSGVALVGYDVWIAYQIRQLLGRGTEPGETESLPFHTPAAGRASGGERDIRFGLGGKLAGLALLALLAGESIAVVPDGSAGVRVSEISGVRPGTLYPGVHLVLPLFESIATYDTKERVYLTSAVEQTIAVAAVSTNPAPGTGGGSVFPAPPANGRAKHKADVLIVQAREGLAMGLGIAVRYRLDPQKLGYIHANVPQPVEEEVVAPVVSSIFRDVAAEYVVR
ncbi:MAG: SPFH domain-containing protein, partial [Bryobacteraceae bacterium]